MIFITAASLALTDTPNRHLQRSIYLAESNQFILSPARPQYFFIGLQNHGMCNTKVIEAMNRDEAFAKARQSCRECRLYDLTPNFTGEAPTANLPQVYKYCPIYK